MQNVPKIVRERLKAATPVANHPDANVLTAFAERSLPELERAIVLEHLARCDDCRDVLALALPTSEPTQAVVSPARGGWLTWPALRWGFVAAGIVAIASLGVRHYRVRPLPQAKVVGNDTISPYGPTQTRTPEAAASAVERRDEAQPTTAMTQPGNAPAPTTGEVTEQRQIARVETPQVSAPQAQVGGQAGGAASLAFHGAAHSQFPHGPQQPGQWQQQSARVQVPPLPTLGAAAKQQSADLIANVKTPAAPQPASAEASGAPTMNVEGQDLEARLQAPSNQPPAQPGYALGGPVGKAKPPVNVEAATTQTVAEGGAPQELPRADNYGMNGRNLSQLSTLAPALPRWTITPTGGLQRSLDQGKTWQDVDVNASFTPSANVTSSNYTSAEVLNRNVSANENNDNYAGKKTLKLPLATVVFRAVAAMGPEVWAGGSQGALYHSLDAGARWSQVVPSADGAILTGDVVAIAFSDPQHGRITTSTAENWTTSDRGQTWQKQ